MSHVINRKIITTFARQAIDLLGLGTLPIIIEFQGCLYGGPFSLKKS
jgi:hypothetical protein